MEPRAHNHTQVTEFVIVGFPGLQPEHFHLVAWGFLLFYVTTVGGNLLLILVFAVEQSLQKPMYITMVSLALSDIGFTTTALPKLIARYWWDDGRIGTYTCIFQGHMIHYFGSLNSLILLTMALDRYLAICFPLRYPLWMTNHTMTGLMAFCWVVTHAVTGISTVSTALLPFCGPDRISQVFCDRVSIAALVCGDTTQLMSSAYVIAMFILCVPLAFIVLSYICIIISISRVANRQGRVRTFSTCATQGCILSIYYVPRLSVYTATYIPGVKMSPDVRIVTPLFYSLLPPLIHPFIYCLRTSEIQKIFRRWVQKRPIAPAKRFKATAAEKPSVNVSSSDARMPKKQNITL
ncbi:olfactory receptor 1-like [Betta splendens]|uniref:Olfactory receptor n=1 Tax=Betta splendens TaxID=158456 RepID=A0A6P7PM72_BETSP|nr:olfactory receptor 1-like [Betta splendens]